MTKAAGWLYAELSHDWGADPLKALPGFPGVMAVAAEMLGREHAVPNL
jgi:hypothetical protein